MKKHIASILFLAIATLPAVAQSKLSAREILDRTTAILNSPGGIKADFTTTLFNGTTPDEVFSGTMDILGEKYVLKTHAICTWFNGKDQWNLIPANGEVCLVTPTSEELQTSSPVAFAGIYKQGFDLSLKSAELRNRKVWEVTLKPQKRKTEPSSIVLNIDKETYYPLCIRVHHQGNWTRISINNFKPNAALVQSHFTFPASEYPQYEVIDMR